MKKRMCTRCTYKDIFNACLLLRSLLDAYYLLLRCVFLLVYFVCTYRGNKKTWRKYMLCEAIKHVLMYNHYHNTGWSWHRKIKPKENEKVFPLFLVFYLFIHLCVTLQKSTTTHETHTHTITYPIHFRAECNITRIFITTDAFVCMTNY